jgi:hypothetical protein
VNLVARSTITLMGRFCIAIPRCTDMSELIFADDLARTLETTEEGVYELARTRKLPFAVSTSRPRRLFIKAQDLGRSALPLRQKNPRSDEADRGLKAGNIPCIPSVTVHASVCNQQILDKKSPRFSTEGLRPTALFLLINAQIAASYVARAGPI